MSTEALNRYGAREPTRSEHRQLAIRHLGLQPFVPAEHRRSAILLAARAAFDTDDGLLIPERLTSGLKAQRLVLPSTDTLERIGVAAVTARWCRRVTCIEKHLFFVEGCCARRASEFWDSASCLHLHRKAPELVGPSSPSTNNPLRHRIPAPRWFGHRHAVGARLSLECGDVRLSKIPRTKLTASDATAQRVEWLEARLGENGRHLQVVSQEPVCAQNLLVDLPSACLVRHDSSFLMDSI